MKPPSLTKYRIVRPVCRKFCFTLFEARDKREDHKVALKILDPDLASDEQVVRNFLRCGQSMQNLKSSRICRVYDYGVDKGYYYIASEIIHGHALEDLRSHSSRTAILKLFFHISKALRYAHLHGLVHGLLNPKSIFVTRGGSIKIDDFGFQWYVPHILRTDDPENLRLQCYIAPESGLEPEKIDGRADIYSLTAILAEMLLGELRTTVNGSKTRRLDLGFLSRRMIELPPGFGKFIKKGLENHPDNRLLNLRAFSSGLTYLKGHASPSPMRLRSTTYTEPDRRYRNPLLGILLALLVIVAVSNSQVRSFIREQSEHFKKFFSHQPYEQAELPNSSIERPDSAGSSPGVRNGGPGFVASKPPHSNGMSTSVSALPNLVTVPEPDLTKEPEVKKAYNHSTGAISLFVGHDNVPLVADVSVDNLYRGQTNNDGRILITGLQYYRPLLITVIKDGFAPKEKTFELKPAKVPPLVVFDMDFKAKPVRQAYLVLEPVPTADAIYIDGVVHSGTPPLRVRVTPGKHRVRFVNSRLGARWENVVQVNADHELHVKHDFINPEYGSVAVSLRNAHEFGYGYVYVDGKIWSEEPNTTPLNIRLPAGLHTISIRRQGYQALPPDTTIVIERNLPKAVSFRLHRTN